MNENDKKIIIDFVKEMKNTQLTKMNSATFKMGALILFITSTLVLIINKIPTRSINVMDIYIFLLFFNCFMSLTLVTFNFLNSNFRKNQVMKNIRSKYNELEKQFMKLPLIYSLFASAMWGITLLSLLIFMIILDYKMWYVVVPNFIIFAFMAFSMFINALYPMILNYAPSEISDAMIETNKNRSTIKASGVRKLLGYIYSTLSYCIPLISIIILYYVNLIFQYKTILILSIYLTGSVLAVAYIIRTFSLRIVFTWWERLYIEIHLRDYSLEEILNELKENHSIGSSIETITFNNKEDSQR